MHAVCHMDKHYSEISDSEESMPDLMGGRGTFAIELFLPPDNHMN